MGAGRISIPSLSVLECWFCHLEVRDDSQSLEHPVDSPPIVQREVSAPFGDSALGRQEEEILLLQNRGVCQSSGGSTWNLVSQSYLLLVL